MSKELTHRLLCQQWEIVHKGLGSNPDGYSFHLSMEDRERYIGRHWGSLRAEHHDVLPDEYEAPRGEPYWVSVTALVHVTVAEVDVPGKRYLSHTPPPPADAVGVYRSTRQKGK